MCGSMGLTRRDTIESTINSKDKSSEEKIAFLKSEIDRLNRENEEFEVIIEGLEETIKRMRKRHLEEMQRTANNKPEIDRLRRENEGLGTTVGTTIKKMREKHEEEMDRMVNNAMFFNRRVYEMRNRKSEPNL